MIKSIRLQNFFGFQDCTINLENGENVLVGINGSGKSNFFKAIKIITNGIQFRGLSNLIYKEWGGIDNVINKCGNRKKDFAEITFEIMPDILPKNNSQTFIYNLKIERIQNVNYRLFESAAVRAPDFEIPIYSFSEGQGKIMERRNGRDSEREIKVDYGKELFLSNPVDELLFPNFSILSEELQRVFCYSEFDTSVNSDIRRSLPPIGVLDLEEDGSNLVQILNLLKLSDFGVFDKILNSLKTVNPNFQGIDFRNFSNQLELHLIETGLNSSIPPQMISDGTLRFLCLMTILYSQKNGSMICIDEPELGLHPDMINTLYQAIKQAAEKSQIIISTHSSHLLDYFNLKNIRVFEKDDNNATVVEQYTNEDFKGWYETFRPGHMWRAGDIGGNRW